ncbi:substrate-binding domain-containing protein [Fulvivirga sediminis]|uniref:Substrate-binding domain-containing protein n=1 Tax=Fulvivirga sediminis TaxID=2803949 RepID=A0A937F473_9BACT|nr:substrate-binding domain-containing protein [Fulvivirga sediminis]MBL3655415.1 substrate-binding domain-containing protein [Fulvivirga sediminis]
MTQLLRFLLALLILIPTLPFDASSQKIGFLLDSYVIDRWYIDQMLFEKKIEELGGKCIVEVPYGDPDQQVKLGKKLIDEDVDVLVIIPTDAKKAIEIVGYAKNAGTPVISYDRLILNSNIDYYISYNNFNVGKLQAQYALNHTKGKNYLLINGPVTDNNAIQFRNGQLSVLQPHIDKGEIKLLDDIVLQNWSELEALIKMDEVFSTINAKPDAIIAANDALARGAIQAMPDAKANEYTITGQDADLESIKAIINGTQSMTVYKPIQPLAEKAAELAIQLAKDKKYKAKNTETYTYENISVNAILLNPVLVDKNNYKETVVKDGHISISEVMERK